MFNDPILVTILIPTQHVVIFCIGFLFLFFVIVDLLLPHEESELTKKVVFNHTKRKYLVNICTYILFVCMCV